MADKLHKVDYQTSHKIEGLKHKKELVLLKIPKDFDLKILQGEVIKLKSKASSGTELLKLGLKDGSEGYSLNIAQNVHKDFNVAFSSENKELQLAAKPFFCELEVVKKTSEANKTDGAESKEFEQLYLEPYMALPQVEGLKVRFKPGGAGQQTVQKSHSVIPTNVENTTDEEKQRRKKKRKRDQEDSTKESDIHHEATQEGSIGGAIKERQKKKKKKKKQ